MSSVKPPEALPLDRLSGITRGRQPLKAYEYLPLAENDDIRLLRVKPGTKGDDLQCWIFHTFFPEGLDDPSERSNTGGFYEALSYAWGSNVKTRGIWVGDALLPVTENLFIALQNLRNPQGYLTLWIDAVCINQDDIPEGNEQVRKMASVFRHAQRTLIWLGEAHEDDAKAFEFLMGFDPIHATARGCSVPCYERNFWSAECLGGVVCDVDPPQELVISDPPLLALARLFQRSWFSRLWIIQEIVHSAIAILVYDQLSCSWQALESYIKLPIRASEGSQCIRKTFDLYLLCFFRSIKWEFDPRSLHEIGLLLLTQNFMCKDPRDRLFALIALYHPVQVKPEIDYTSCCEDVYTQIAVRSLQDDKSFRILLSSTTYDPKESASQLPSWIPDWRKKFDLLSTFTVPIAQGDSSFRCSKFESTQRHVVQDTSELVIRGCVFDRIEVTSEILLPAWTGPEVEDASLSGLAQLVDKVNLFISSIQSSPEVRDVRDILRILIVFDTGEEAQEQWDEFLSRGLFWKRFLPRQSTPVVLWEQSLELGRHYVRCMRAKRMAQTGKRHLGLIPGTAQVGDVIVIFDGSAVPHVLRSIGNTHKLLGECYIDGIMYGEAFETQFVLERKEFRIS